MKRFIAVLLATVLVVTGLFVLPTSAATIVAKGIDVSVWQGSNINWTAVKNSGHGDFAILRAYCLGKDSTFDINYERAKQAEVGVGAYCFIYGRNETEVRNEVNGLLSVIQGKQFEYPIYIDVEDANTYAGVGRQTTTNLAKMACQMLEDAGYFAGIYTYTNFANNYIYMDQLTAHTTWIAEYNYTCNYTGAYAMWQYGCTGNVGGINPVDVNYSYMDFPTIIKSLGFNNFEPSVAYPYDVDSGTKMLYDGENKGSISTAFSTTATVHSGDKTQGDNSLKLTFNNPGANASGNKVGGMAVLKFTNKADLRDYNYIQYDVYLSREMTGSNGLQVNFITDTTEDGYNFMKPINDWAAGWHTVTVAKGDIPKAVASADWSNINKIRVLWFNYAGTAESTYFLIDNLRAFKENPIPPEPSEPSQPSQPEPSEPESSIPEPSEPESSLPEPSQPEDPVHLGDVYEDGSIDAKDALEVLKFAVGKTMLTEKQQKAAEVIGDSGIDAKDALEILKFSVGKIFKFPIEG